MDFDSSKCQTQNFFETKIIQTDTRFNCICFCVKRRNKTVQNCDNSQETISIGRTMLSSKIEQLIVILENQELDVST